MINLTSPARRFVDYLGDVGPRWGLPREACRVHACLYLAAQPEPGDAIVTALGMDRLALDEALAYLSTLRLVTHIPPDLWRTSTDPWELLATALQERQRRELPDALASLRDFHRDALADASTDAHTAVQVGKVRDLLEDLADLGVGARRISPGALRGLIGFSARAARVIARTIGSGREREL